MSLLNRDEVRSIGLSSSQVNDIYETIKNSIEHDNKFVKEVCSFCKEKIREHEKNAFELENENEKELNEELELSRQYKELLDFVRAITFLQDF